jgi:uncharacterized membrane protein YfhO
MKLLHYWTVEAEASSQLRLITSAEFDPVREVVLENEPGLTVSGAAGPETVKWIDHSTDEIEVEARTAQPSILLVTDNYDPGWEATSFDDSSQKKYKVLSGDYFLRAIPLNAGYHHFRLRYRPWAFEVGKWVSLLSCFLYIAILISVFRRNKSLERSKNP